MIQLRIGRFGYVNMIQRRAYQLVNANSDDRILEIGCAEGLLSQALSEEAKTVVCIDINKRLLCKAKERCNKINLVLASATHLCFRDGFFDKVCITEVIEHLGFGEELICINEINRILRESGILVLSTPNKGKVLQYIFLDPAFCIRRHRHFSVEEVMDLLRGAGFNIDLLITSGGPIFVIMFYSLFWKVKDLGLLRFGLIRKGMDFLRFIADLEFALLRKDGSTILSRAKKVAIFGAGRK